MYEDKRKFFQLIKAYFGNSHIADIEHYPHKLTKQLISS